MGASAGCSRQGDRTNAAAVRTTGENPPARPVPLPVALPDLSHLAISVRDQIQSTHAALMVATTRSDAPASELASAYGAMGKLLLAAEFGQTAESCFLNAQLLAPGDRRWAYYLGHVYKAQGENARSSAAFEQALRLGPDDIATLIWLGETYLMEDRLDSAHAVFAKALLLRPGEGAAQAGLGRVALAKRDYAAAVKHLEEALARDQKGDAVHYSLAMAYRGLGDSAKAEAHIAQRGKGQIVFPDPLMDEVREVLHSARNYESLGIQSLEAGNPVTAATYFRKGIDLAPDDASLHHRLGTALFLAGDATAGRNQFETALRLAPDLARAHYSLGVLMASAGQHQQAITRLSSAVRHDPGYVEARLLLGDILRHTGQAKESLHQYGAVIKIDPRIAEAQLGYAMALVASGDYPKAVERLISATKTHQDHSDLIQALARLLAAAPDARVRNGAEALALMQRLLRLLPDPGPEVTEAMAMAYAETGDYRQAVAWQRQAIAAAERTDRAAGMGQAMRENLSLFERGEPCRTPWADYAMP